MHLPGSVAFITGAAQGLGKAFSELLLKGGASVFLTDIQLDKGKETEHEFKEKYGKDKVVFLQCDVSSEESLSSAFQKAVSEFGAVDLMVNNAGIVNESKIKATLDINLFGVITGTNLAIEHMRKDTGGKGGTIINVSSMAGLVPLYLIPTYAASKHGVVGYTSSWATNPRINAMGLQLACLCPAFTDTAILNVDEKRVLFAEDYQTVIQSLGINTVDDVASSFLQLVESDTCNGDIVKITVKHGVQYLNKTTKPESPL